MPSRSIRLDHGAINNLLRGRGGAVNRVMGGFAGLATKTVREVADERITHHTGAYRRSIKADLSKPDRVTVSANVPYALYLERGTRPHRIVARRANFLRFEIGGQVLYRREVQHPGTKPYHILRDGVGRAGTQLNRLARR